MRRTGIHDITFTARCESGLHIGGSRDELSIGGADNPVITHPASDKPYIPGSSLKGKMRGELEKRLGKFGRGGTSACRCAGDDCPVCRVFGAHMNPESELGPSRILVRDGRVAGEFRMENKTENVINRRSGSARDPRSNERVAAGAEFQMKIALQVFDYDNNFEYEDMDGAAHAGGEALQAVVADCLQLVQRTGLGGGISRGSGEVSFHNFQMDGKSWKLWSE